MGIVSKWLNRPLSHLFGEYAWLVLLALPTFAMALIVGSIRGVGGFFAGGYAGLTLTIITLVAVRVISVRSGKR